MTVEKLIKELQKMNPKAQVKLNGKSGSPALFALTEQNKNDVVWIECSDDIDMRQELIARFEEASKKQLDELDFFMDLLETGFTLYDIELFYPEVYKYREKFMREHGLMQQMERVEHMDI